MKINSTKTIILGSLVLAIGLGLLLVPHRQSAVTSSAEGAPKPSLLVYCAAGIKAPVEAIALAYEKEFGVKVQLQYGGSGTLLSNLRVAKTGDLFVAADTVGNRTS